MIQYMSLYNFIYELQFFVITVYVYEIRQKMIYTRVEIFRISIISTYIPCLNFWRNLKTIIETSLPIVSVA